MDSEHQYTIMLICLNGHISNDRLELLEDIHEEYCHICGSKTITACPHCHALIRGIRKIPGVFSTRSLTVRPAEFCYQCGEPYPWHKPVVFLPDNSLDTPASTLRYILSRFPMLVRQLSVRYDNRETLEIKDEHDVQDFVQVLLTLFFDHIEPMENRAMHNYGGNRFDLFFRDQRIVLVIKMTGSMLKNEKLIAHIKSDFDTYSQRPDCDSLIYFVYDPENLLTNPLELKDQMEAIANGNLQLTVYIFSQSLW